MPIDRTAIISNKAKLADDVSVGPYTVINEGVSIGSGTRIGSHALITGNTTIGRNCEIFTGAVVGSRPQDLKYNGEEVFLDIGDNNIIREYCTLNPGTEDKGRTIVGSGNLYGLFSYCS